MRDSVDFYDRIVRRVAYCHDHGEYYWEEVQGMFEDDMECPECEEMRRKS